MSSLIRNQTICSGWNTSSNYFRAQETERDAGFFQRDRNLLGGSRSEPPNANHFVSQPLFNHKQLSHIGIMAIPPSPAIPLHGVNAVIPKGAPIGPCIRCLRLRNRFTTHSLSGIMMAIPHSIVFSRLPCFWRYEFCFRR